METHPRPDKTRWLLRCAALLAGAACPALAGCGGPGGGHDPTWEDPAGRFDKVLRSGEDRDRAAIPKLVEYLGHDDPALRMMAIQALERITGERFGYKPYAARVERDAAAARWVEAVRAGAAPRRVE